MNNQTIIFEDYEVKVEYNPETGQFTVVNFHNLPEGFIIMDYPDFRDRDNIELAQLLFYAYVEGYVDSMLHENK